MIRNYFKIAWRNLIKNKGYSAINIGGLAVGMAVVLLIGLWIYDEVSYNKNHENYNEIAQVLKHSTSNGKSRTLHIIPYPLGDELRAKYGDHFKHVVMSSSMDERYILSQGSKDLSFSGAYMEPGVLSMLSLKMIYGDWNGLKSLNNVVISESAAKRLFGTENPLGKSLKINHKLETVVAGVYTDMPLNSEFHELEFIAPWELYVTTSPWVKEARDKKIWGNNSYQLYVQIATGANMADVSEKIKQTIYNNASNYTKKSHPELVLHPMKKWHLYSEWKDKANVGGLIQQVWLFGIVGVFVLLLACINFMNLSTAQSEKRAKEVGVRKAIGSLKHQLVNQFLSESFLVVLLAFLVAVALVILVLPLFNSLADKQLSFPYNSVMFYLVSVGCIVVTSLLAGSYPAFYLSSFRVVSVLKGTFKAGASVTSFRRTLVVVQFTVSIVLIIGTIVVQKQINHSKNRPIGYESEGLVLINKTTEEFEGKYNVLRHALLKTEAVTEMAETSSPLTDVWFSGGGFRWEGKDPDFLAHLTMVKISHDYGKTVGWKLLEGRDFSREFSTDSTAMVINKAAAAYMGLKAPLGKTIRWNRKKFNIIGVVDDIVAESPFEPTRQAVYMINYSNTNFIALKLNPEKSVSASLAAIKAAFNQYLPNVPIEYEFVDKTFAIKFAAIERVRKLTRIFSMLAIFISCLGLFGLASFMAEQRKKEIGVRKVVGASVFNLWKLLSKDFVKLVVLAIVIATPLAYYGVNSWLNNYTYRIQISWWIFVVAGMGAIAITLLTVSFQALKAAVANPIKSLRTE